MGLPTFLLAYAAGIGIAPFFPPATLISVGTPLIALLWLCCRRSPAGRVLLPVFFLFLGFSLYHLEIGPPSSRDHVSAFAGDRKIALTGTVIDIAARTLDRSVLDIEAQQVTSSGIAAPATGKVRLYIDRGYPVARAGDIVRLHTRIRSVHAFGTPGEFDYPRHLARNDIFATAFLPSADDLVVVRREASPGLLADTRRHRQTLGQFIDRHLPAVQAPLVRALVLGDKQGITTDQRNLLGRGGVSHLFAISGLHLGLIAGFLYYGGRALYRRCPPLLQAGPPRRLLPPLLLPLLWGYLLLTGSALPTFRAFVMVLAGALLFFGGRRTPPLKLLAATAFLILCFDPLALFLPSFQLSFAGVFGIVTLLPSWQKRTARLPRMLKPVAALFGATLAATIATAPIALWHFHLFAPAGLVTNFAAVPAVGFLAVPLGLGGVLLHPFSTTTAAILFQACGLIVEGVLRLVEAIISLPPFSGRMLYASPLEHGGLLMIVGALLLAPAATSRLATIVTAAAGGILLLAWPSSPPGLAVTVLSVGQGDAILLSRADGEHYLIDGGGLYSETFDVGERLVAPALGHLGIDRLKAVMLTHDDPDHRKGLLHVMEHFPVEEFWSPAPAERLHGSLRDVLRRRKIPVREYAPGWTMLEEDEKNSLAVFSPPLEGSDNDRSLVLYARHHRNGVLLTGDLESAGVRALADASPPGPVTLLKLPHHGSRHSSPEFLCERLAPRIAFVSAGKNNRHGHPHQQVVDELRRRAVPLFRTDLFGTLRFLSDGEDWETRRWLRGLFR